MELKLISAAELMNMKFNRRETIAAELESAARILRENARGERDGSVAWRVADAGLMLRRLIEANGDTDVQGVDVPTGMGAMLPTSNVGGKR